MMLEINKNIKIKKYKVPLLLICVMLGGIFLFQYLTFIPEYSSAESITTPICNGEECPTLSTLTYMQDMTSEVCGYSKENETKRLIDKRDGKSYWVTKLADGNCWMAQNLDLDLGIKTAGVDTSVLSPETSDVTQDWTPPATRTDDINSGWRDLNTAIQSWDPGLLVYSTPMKQNDCGTSVAQIRLCPNWQDVTGWSAANSEGVAVVDAGNRIYDAHYLVGNYYSWNAATAGSGGVMVNGDAEDSICPKGWKLPTGKSDNGSFGYLLSRYNFAQDVVNERYDLRGRPLYFLYGGYINLYGLSRAGYTGDYYSSTASSVSDNHVYGMDFDLKIDISGAYDYRYAGMSLRCMVKARDVSIEGPDINNPNVSVVASSVIALEVSKEEVDIETKTDEVNKGEFMATVASNRNYTLSLNATGGAEDATSLVNYKDGNKLGEIKTIEGEKQPVAGVSSWGIRVCNGLNVESCEGINFLGLPAQNVTNTFVADDRGNHQYLFQIGVGVGSELPSGVYTTAITVTASQK